MDAVAISRGSLTRRSCSDAQRTLLDHAQRFSETHARRRTPLQPCAGGRAEDDEESQTDYSAGLEDWASRTSRAPIARSTPLDRLLGRSWRRSGRATAAKTRVFVDDWFGLTEDPSRMLADAALVDRIRERERRGQAATGAAELRRRARDMARSGRGRPVEYRWASTQRQLLDIIEAGEAYARAGRSTTAA